MSPFVAVLLLLGLTGAAACIGLVVRARVGRVRSIADDAPLRPEDLAVEGAFGERATLVQLSTPYCSACPATARLLASLAASRAGVRHVEVDLERHPRVASRFDVLQTPTTLLLDASGRLRARVGGAPRGADLERALEAVAGGVHVA